MTEDDGVIAVSGFVTEQDSESPERGMIRIRMSSPVLFLTPDQALWFGQRCTEWASFMMAANEQIARGTPIGRFLEMDTEGMPV